MARNYWGVVAILGSKAIHRSVYIGVRDQFILGSTHIFGLSPPELKTLLGGGGGGGGGLVHFCFHRTGICSIFYYRIRGTWDPIPAHKKGGGEICQNLPWVCPKFCPNVTWFCPKFAWILTSAKKKLGGGHSAPLPPPPPLLCLSQYNCWE